MKQKRLWLLNLLLLLSSYRNEQLLIARPTSTKLPAASATATRGAKLNATAQARTSMEATTAQVNDWALKFLPRRGPDAGSLILIDEDTRRIEVRASPKALASMTNSHVQLYEPIPRADWPPTLLEALAGQDPSITVVLIPDTIIVTPTLTLSGTVAP